MKKILAILIGLVIIGTGIFLFINQRGLSKRCTVEAVATVVEIKVDESLEEEDGITRTVYTYSPVLEYTAGDKTVSKESSTASNTPEYKVNDKVDILYNPDNVEEYIIKGDTTSNLVGIVFVVVGVVVTLIGIIKKF